jgi:hypothetical protein
MMKKVLLSAVVLVMLGITAVGAKNKPTIDSRVLSSFKNEFNKVANEQWSSDENYFYVSFEKNGELVSAVYDKEDGELVGTAVLKDASQIPASVKETLQKKLEGYQLTGKVIEISYPQSGAYVVSVENEKTFVTVRVEGKTVTVVNKMEKM